MTRGKFIAFEGIDGCGKSTQLRMCAEKLREMGRAPVTLREPGGTETGEKLRQLILDSKHSLDMKAELFLFMACRAQLVDEVIRPELLSGRDVLCDRFLWSSVAYQGGGLGLGVKTVLRIGDLATDCIHPDMYMIFDVEPAVSQERRGKNADRIESRDGEFHATVRDTYKWLATKFPHQATILNANGTVEEVFKHTWSKVTNVLGLDNGSQASD